MNRRAHGAAFPRSTYRFSRAKLPYPLVLSVLVTRAIDDFKLSIPIVTLVVLLIAAAFAGVLAAIIPARRAAKLDVLEALAYE